LSHTFGKKRNHWLKIKLKHGTLLSYISDYTQNLISISSFGGRVDWKDFPKKKIMN